MFCHKCGSALPDNARFCTGCGAKQEVTAAQTPPPEQSPEPPAPLPPDAPFQTAAPQPHAEAAPIDSIDGGRAFTFFSKDPAWVKKVLIGGLVILIPLLGILILMGYQLRIIKNVAGGAEIPLPEWELGEQLKNGFMLFLCNIGIVIITGVPLGLISSIVPILGPIVAFFGEIAVAFYMISATSIIGVEGDFGAMFQFGRVIAIVRNNLVPLLLVSLFSFGAYIIGLLGIIGLLVGILFTIVLAMMIIAHLVGQFYIVARAAEK